MNLLELLKKVSQEGADEVLLAAGQVPLLRSPAQVRPLDSTRLQDRDLLAQLELARSWGMPELGRSGAWQGMLGVPGLGRCRLTWRSQGGQHWACWKLLAQRLEQPLERWNLHSVVAEMARLRSGLLLMSGPRRSGLSTTLAYLLEHLRHQVRVLTSLESPIEFLLGHGASLVCQREWGHDFDDWGEATAHSIEVSDTLLLPILDGQLARLAIEAAEAGLLVIAHLPAIHSLNALDRFCHGLDGSGWLQRLAEVLRASYSQRLVPTAEGYLPICDFLPAEACRQSLWSQEERPYPEWLEGREGAWSLVQSLQHWIDAEQLSAEEAQNWAHDWL